jgi:hypothetical protein
MENTKQIDVDRIMEHVSILVGYAQAMLDELTIIEAVAAGDTEAADHLESL